MDRKKFQMRCPRNECRPECFSSTSKGKLLVVEPTYKMTWEIPGGVVEANESPRQTAIREARGGIGIAL